MSQANETSNQVKLVASTGPWPFLTRQILARPGGERFVLRSRHHRKRLRVPAQAARINLLRCLWMPRQLNWWIGSVFAIGSMFFGLGSVLILAPTLAQEWSLDTNAVNAIFFAGSIPFTIAAYLQLFQAANAGEFLPHGGSTPKHRVLLFGWRPREIGWLSCVLQFAGTLLFNINTFDAMLPGLDRLRQDLFIWAPDFTGSILFLASGYLAFAETCHAYWAWQPCSLSWWVTIVNLLGCVAFMISAVFAFVPARSPEFAAATVSVAFTLIGAVGFLLGSLLMLQETAVSAGTRPIAGEGTG